MGVIMGIVLISVTFAAKHIDWYTERCGRSAFSPFNKTSCDEALEFMHAQPALVDGLMPCCSMLQIDCSTGVLAYGVDQYDFSMYAPFLQQGKEVRVTLSGTDGQASCCASIDKCPMLDNATVLAQQLLDIALKFNLTGYTGDWEWAGRKNFYWQGWNASMAHVASVLMDHGIRLGNGIVSNCAGDELCGSGEGNSDSDPCCCPAYRNTPWADVLTDMGMYSILSNNPSYHKCHGHDPILQYCGWEGGMMNALHSPVATVHADRAPQLSPALWIGDCVTNGTTAQGWTQSNLRSFLSFLDAQNITRIGIWCMTNESDPIGFPCQVTNCPWMIEELVKWKTGR